MWLVELTAASSCWRCFVAAFFVAVPIFSVALVLSHLSYRVNGDDVHQ